MKLLGIEGVYFPQVAGCPISRAFARKLALSEVEGWGIQFVVDWTKYVGWASRQERIRQLK